ncbi:MAG: C39 family peptidase [Firmicutes bacterium]|nr:C39 family peptidase [Bacillota bacterium]
MKKKFLTSTMAVCTAVCMSVTAFASNSANTCVDEVTQSEAYQSAAYCEALDTLKKAEQDFIEQEALADAEEASIETAAENNITVPSSENTYDASANEDHAPIIGEFKPSPYWESLEALKLADMNYREVCASLGVEERYNSILNSNNNEGSMTAQPYSTTAESKRLSIYQVPQERSYWCGYAAMKSLLDYEGVSMTQEEIAKKVYSPDQDCPWYFGDGTTKDLYPVPNVLKELTGFNYIPYPIHAAGSEVLTESAVRARVTSTINLGHGLLACGESYRTYDQEGSRLPGYPYRRISHWVAIDGYSSEGYNVWIVDPAKSDVISWSGNISAYYSIPSEKLASFATMRGLVW